MFQDAQTKTLDINLDKVSSALRIKRVIRILFLFQDEAKPKANVKNDAELEAHIAKKEKRGHKRHGPHRKWHEDEAKRHAHHMHHKEFHKRHHGNGGPLHPNDVRRMKEKLRQKMLEHDLPHEDKRLKRIMKTGMKMIKKGQRHLPRMNDSRGQLHKEKAHWKFSSVLLSFNTTESFSLCN